MGKTTFVLLLAALLAGCTTTDANNPATPTPSAATPGTGGGAPVAVKSDTHDFATDAAGVAPGGAPATAAFTVPAGVSTLNVTVKFAPDSGAPGAVTSGVTVKVGKVSCAVPAGPVTAPSSCTGSTSAAGVKSIEYSGAGPVTATVMITGT